MFEYLPEGIHIHLHLADQHSHPKNKLIEFALVCLQCYYILFLGRGSKLHTLYNCSTTTPFLNSNSSAIKVIMSFALFKNLLYLYAILFTFRPRLIHKNELHECCSCKKQIPISVDLIHKTFFIYEIGVLNTINAFKG